MSGMTKIVISGASSGYQQRIVAREHTLTGNSSSADGGTNAGATPYEFLLAALGS